MDFGTEKIRGIDFKIKLNSSGQFSCEVDGEDFTSPTLEGLKKKLTEHSRARQKKIAIPFCCFEQDWNDEEGKLVHGICVGIHAGSNNLLVKMGGSVHSEQRRNWGSDKVVSPKDGAELKRLCQAVKVAATKRDEFLEKHAIDLRALVHKELEK
jgi:hypothetical protein